jgi:hypothetical protein
MNKVALLLVVAGMVAADAQFAAGQNTNAETRRREAERSAVRQRLVDQADATWDREMARETAGDCRGSDTTRDYGTCLAQEVTTTEANLKAYSGAFRAIFALLFSESSRVSGPTGTPPTADEFINEFDDMETKWGLYRTAICSAAYDFYRGGTIAPDVSSRCDLRVMRNHMRELGRILGESFHR